MTIKPGGRVLLECEVKPGPFSDERLIRIKHEEGEWVGFVPVSLLEEPSKETGKTRVRAIIVEVIGDKFIASIPGHALSTQPLEGETSKLSVASV